jgi:hypothetical protein
MKSYLSWRITTKPEGPSPWLPSTTTTAAKIPETTKQKTCRKAMLAETT